MGRFEIVVVRDTVYTYPTTWKNLKLTAKHVGEIWEMIIANVRENGQPWGTVFTGYGL